MFHIFFSFQNSTRNEISCKIVEEIIFLNKEQFFCKVFLIKI